tara:strand:+ start:4017 stop:4157 length:141 start_codon:yes stop_codon:yes gene_type:complete
MAFELEYYQKKPLDIRKWSTSTAWDAETSTWDQVGEFSLEYYERKP